MIVRVVRRDRSGMQSTSDYTCTHATVDRGVLRLDDRPNRQQEAVGMHTITHVISIPLDNIWEWKES